jgi:hypothetical protein
MPDEITPEPEFVKCGAVKHGGVTLRCGVRRDHDKPQDGKPGTWHMASYTDTREIVYDGSHHEIRTTETVTWEPVDHIREATRHILAARPDPD